MTNPQPSSFEDVGFVENLPTQQVTGSLLRTQPLPGSGMSETWQAEISISASAGTNIHFGWIITDKETFERVERVWFSDLDWQARLLRIAEIACS